MNYLDYIIIAILIFYGLWGLAKGFLKLILDLAGYVVAFLAAKLFSPYLIEYINGTMIPTHIQNNIYDTFARVSPNITRSLETMKIPDNINDLIAGEPGLSDVFATFPQIKTSINSNIASLSGQPFLETLTHYIVAILCAVAIFLVVKILFSIVASVFLSRQEHFPLAITNRILGMAVGLIIAVGIISLGLQFVEAYSLASTPVLSETLANSKYGHLFTTLPLLDWIQNILPK